jgi:hypothetical protein
LKGEVDELKKLITEYGTNKLPDNVLDLDAVRNEIEVALEPIKASVSKLEADTQSQFEAVRDELKAIADRVVEIPVSIESAPTTPCNEKPTVDGDNKTWGEFFKMVGIDALAAVEAQKKENATIRTQQVEQGLQAAREQGLGEWQVLKVGRLFARVDTTPT